MISLATGFIIISLLMLKMQCRFAGIISGIISLPSSVLPLSLMGQCRLIITVSIHLERRGLESGGELISGRFHGTVKIINWTELENIILTILPFLPFGYLLPGLFPHPVGCR